jgi:hypothetical protein
MSFRQIAYNGRGLDLHNRGLIMAVSLSCPGCGRRLRLAEDPGARGVRCPDCGEYCERKADRPGGSPPKAEPPAESRPHKSDRASSAAGGYAFETSDERRCPGCDKVLTAQDTPCCTVCGRDLTGKKVRKVFEPVQRSWESGTSFRARVRIFVVAQTVVLSLAALGAFLEGAFLPFFFPWVFFTVLFAFLMGTYERTDLSRDQRGRVSLTKTWRVCFFARAPEKIQPHRFAGLRTSATYGITAMNIALIILLCALGLIPAILLWYFDLRKPTYYVYLTDEYGHSNLRIYTGKSDQTWQEIADTLHSVTGLTRHVG